METFGYLLGLVSYVYIWDAHLLKSICYIKTDLGYQSRGIIFEYIATHKPFNCATCLAGWIGLILFAFTFDIYFLSLPILYKILTK